MDADVIISLGYAEHAASDARDAHPRKARTEGEKRSAPSLKAKKNPNKRTKTDIRTTAKIFGLDTLIPAASSAKPKEKKKRRASPAPDSSPDQNWGDDEDMARLIMLPGDLPMPDIPLVPLPLAPSYDSVAAGPAAVPPAAAGPQLPRTVTAQRFEFDDDPRAMQVEHNVTHSTAADTVSKVINFNDRLLKTGIFGLAFAFNRHGQGAVSGPFAQHFLAKPGVARALAECWREFAMRAPCVEQEGRRYALKDLSDEGGYGLEWQAIQEGFMEAGMPPPELQWSLPEVTVGPPKMSAKVTKGGKRMERIATLEIRLPIPAGSPLANVPPAKEETKDVASATVDRSYPFARANYRTNRLGVFEEAIRHSNQTAAEDAAVRAEERLSRDAVEFFGGVWNQDAVAAATPEQQQPSPAAAGEGGRLVRSPHNPDTEVEAVDVFVALRGSSNNASLLCCSLVQTSELLAVNFANIVLCN